MSENLLDRLAEIREKQGRTPIDGTRIQDDPLADWTPPTPTAPPEYIHEDPDEEPEKEVSPLVRAALPEPKSLPQIPIPDLAVLDSLASYQGHDVKLNDSETRQVKAVIVRALQRDLRDKMSALKSLEPRRQRKSKPAQPRLPKSIQVQGPTGPPTTVHDPETIAAVVAGAKRRGRPRGSLLK